MKVIFTTTTKSKLATLPITNGQIIALSDAVGYYYDMGGVRYPASSTQVLDALPGNGIVDMLYIVNNSVYTWDGTNYVKLISSVEIDDANASTATAYSSSKTEELVSGIINNSSASTATAYSSSKTEEVANAAAAAIISDSAASTATAYSSTKVETLIQGITSFEIEIVQVLPTEDIDTHKIYFLEKSTPGQANVYEEYMYIENTWELIGTTEVTISLATTATAGIVKPDGTTISVAADGTITAIGGGSSGHTIMTDAGSTVSAEDNLQFKGAYVEDDSQNDKTVVNVVREMQYSQVAGLTDAQKKGIIITEKDRRPASTVINAENTAYSNVTSGLASTTVQGAIDELADGAGGGGGHVIENQSGSTMTQRANLQFLDATPVDDSTNDATQIEVVKVITKSQLDSAPDGIYRISDEDDSSLSTNAANVTYNNTTSGLTATNVQDAIDEVIAAATQRQVLASVTADGTLTRKQILNALFAQLTLPIPNAEQLHFNRLTATKNFYFAIEDVSSTALECAIMVRENSSVAFSFVTISSNSSWYGTTGSVTGLTDSSSVVATEGEVWEIVKN